MSRTGTRAGRRDTSLVPTVDKNITRDSFPPRNKALRSVVNLTRAPGFLFQASPKARSPIHKKDRHSVVCLPRAALGDVRRELAYFLRLAGYSCHFGTR